MKTCPNCNSQVEDNAVFCNSCGFRLDAQAAPQNPAPAVVRDSFDHTAEYDPQDISDNKVFAMLIYLGGIIGILIALLASNTSAYIRFQIRQALKIEVLTLLGIIVSVLLVWTIIVPIAIAIFIAVLSVVKIICFFQICSNKVVEPYIVRSFTFLK